MGKAQEGLWIIGLSIFYFTFFLVVLTVVNVADHYNLDKGNINYHDPGFQTIDNDPFTQPVGCKGVIYSSCSDYDDNEQNCDLMPGCNYTTCYTIPGFNFTSFPCCVGRILDPNLTYSLFEVDCSFVDIYNSSDRLCGLIDGCTWRDFMNNNGSTIISPFESFDFTSLTSTIGIMTGFSAELDMPISIRFIISFFFFYIPSITLIIGIILLLPIH